MAEHKPTRGPWKIEGTPGYAAPEITGDGRRIAKVLYDYGSEDPEVDANARLIAAAPDLYAVCCAYEAWEADVIMDADWRDSTPRLTQAQCDRLIEIQAMRNAAIARAKGAAE